MKTFNKININILHMDKILKPDKNFDIIKREIDIQNKKAVVYYVDGFAKDEVLQDFFRFLLGLKQEQVDTIKNVDDFVKHFATYPELSTDTEFSSIVTGALSGMVALFIDGISECVLVDVREYPHRAVKEPDKDKVLRGAKDGFIETALFNVTMIRRRIRNPNLTFEHLTIGEENKNDIFLAYMDGAIDNKMLEKIKNKISNLKISGLNFGSQSLAEALVTKKWFNPFPKVKFTERPDTATANILEGKLLLVVDNSPSVIILPTYLLDFFEETEDYYFSPPIAFYLKTTRIIISIITVLITPIWLLAVNNMDILPDFLGFLKPQEFNSIPIIFQLLALEILIDVIKSASINTPNMIANSISLIGAVILGDIAITTKLVVPEAMLYTALAAIGYFSQPSFELGYATKFMRILLLVMIALFNFYGLIVGIIAILVIIGTNKTITGDSYLYPIIPFDFNALKKKFVREKFKTC